MRVDAANGNIYVRQSWIGDYLICGERARYGLVLPSFRSGSDATAIGTGIHSGIEWALTAHSSLEDVDYDQLCEYTQEQVAMELSKPVKLTRISENPDKIAPSVSAMITAWYESIAVDVEWGGATELRFRYPSGMTAVNGFDIWYEGTIDYVEPSGRLWDWKTASRPYNIREKQEKNVQASVYCQFRAQETGVTDQSFNFGVMVRQLSPKAQVVEVVRDGSHYRWLNRQVQTMVNNALLVGESNGWPMNDQHVLCSSTWCDFWSVCKGSV